MKSPHPMTISNLCYFMAFCVALTCVCIVYVRCLSCGQNEDHTNVKRPSLTVVVRNKTHDSSTVISA